MALPDAEMPVVNHFGETYLNRDGGVGAPGPCSREMCSRAFLMWKCMPNWKVSSFMQSNKASQLSGRGLSQGTHSWHGAAPFLSRHFHGKVHGKVELGANEPVIHWLVTNAVWKKKKPKR